MNFGGAIRLNPIGVFVLVALSFILILYATSSSDQKTIADSTVNLKDLLAVAVYAAERGGQSIKSKNSVLNKKIKGKTKEGADEFVTDADRESHCVMYDALHAKYPKLKIISEEDVSIKMCKSEGFIKSEKLNFHLSEEIEELSNVYISTDDLTVWIDPLDATQEFTEQMFKYVTTMVCVAIKGKPVIGIIHRPFLEYNSTSWAWKPFGMSSNLRTIKNNLKMDWNKLQVLISRSHAGHIDKILKKKFPTASVIPAGGAGYKVLELIDGNASVYLHITAIKKWDICAGDAILRAVDGRMSTLLNEDINYSSDVENVNFNGILASLTNHKELYENFKELLPGKNS